MNEIFYRGFYYIVLCECIFDAHRIFSSNARRLGFFHYPHFGFFVFLFFVSLNKARATKYANTENGRAPLYTPYTDKHKSNVAVVVVTAIRIFGLLLSERRCVHAHERTNSLRHIFIQPRWIIVSPCVGALYARKCHIFSVAFSPPSLSFSR